MRFKVQRRNAIIYMELNRQIYVIDMIELLTSHILKECLAELHMETENI